MLERRRRTSRCRSLRWEAVTNTLQRGSWHSMSSDLVGFKLDHRRFGGTADTVGTSQWAQRAQLEHHLRYAYSPSLQPTQAWRRIEVERMKGK